MENNLYNIEGTELTSAQQQQLLTYYEMLVEKNKVMNLTAITDYDEVVEKHFADSLSINRVVDMQQVQSVIDIGTGAGFPGMVLKIAYPHLEMTLADSVNKKVTFLQEVIAELGLSDIQAVHGRAEDLAHTAGLREHFDLVVSRAVANLSTLSEYCLPFVKQGGRFVAYKSVDVDEEVQVAEHAIQQLGGRIQTVEKFHIGGNSRSLVVIDKLHSTPGKYPRKAGIPARQPL